MQVLVRVLVATLFLVPAATAAVRCGDGSGDDAAVAAARAQVDHDCDCAGAARHGDYVRCAVGIAQQRAGAGLLPPQCVSAVKRCAARSTCGRAGFVTCCRTRDGVTRCSVKRSADSCRPPLGGSACVGVFTSCCDACMAGGCAPTTTSTTTTSTTSTTSTTIPYIPCTGGSGAPACDGSCDPGLECLVYAEFPPGGYQCACFPTGTTTCNVGLFPRCSAGACPGATLCGGWQYYDPQSGNIFSGCGCVDPAQPCSSGSGGQCVSAGYCDPGFACQYTPIAPHANCPCCGCGFVGG